MNNVNPRDAEHLQTWLEYIKGIPCRSYLHPTAIFGWVEAFDDDGAQAMDRTPLPLFTYEGEVLSC